MILPDSEQLPGDVYFSDAQQARLQELKSCQETLTVEERTELDGLIEAAFDATIARTKAYISWEAPAQTQDGQ